MFDLFKLENSNVYFLQKNGLFAFIGYPFRYLMDFTSMNEQIHMAGVAELGL